MRYVRVQPTELIRVIHRHDVNKVIIPVSGIAFNLQNIPLITESLKHHGVVKMNIGRVKVITLDTVLSGFSCRNSSRYSISDVVKENGKPVLKDNIELEIQILIPYNKTSCLSKEYHYSSIDEIKGYISRAKKEDLGTLFIKVKKI